MRFNVEFDLDGDFVVMLRLIDGEWIEVARLLCPGSQLDAA